MVSDNEDSGVSCQMGNVCKEGTSLSMPYSSIRTTTAPAKSRTFFNEAKSVFVKRLARPQPGVIHCPVLHLNCWPNAVLHQEYLCWNHNPPPTIAFKISRLRTFPGVFDLEFPFS